jgi:hypothetical protein
VTKEGRCVRSISLCAFVFFAGMGCARKAPGPKECVALAERVVGIEDRRMLSIPQVKERVDRITVECLTVPYDRTLVRCIGETGQARACFVEFRLRRAPGAPPELKAPL